MITINIQKQGSAAIMTILSDVFKTKSKKKRKRYSLAELLHGTTPNMIDQINADTAWAREGDPIGRERL